LTIYSLKPPAGATPDKSGGVSPTEARYTRYINALIAVAIVTILIPFCFSAIALLDGDLSFAEDQMRAGLVYLLMTVIAIILFPLVWGKGKPWLRW
jgi:hypothetical protein